MNLWETLSLYEINSALCIPVGRNAPEGFFLDLVLVTDSGTVRIRGESTTLLPKVEAFYLTVEELDSAQWWQPVPADADWKPRDLVKTLEGTPVHAVFKNPREVRLFKDPEDFEKGLTCRGPLRSAAAAELRSLPNNREARLVIYATPEYPCSVEVAVAPRRCDEILSGLVELGH